MVALDVEWVRKQFPSLKKGYVFMDNAGGSQTLGRVMDRMVEYLTEHNVQLGASYEVSQKCSAVLDEVQARMAALINAKHTEEIVIGPTSSIMLKILSQSIGSDWPEGSEIVVTNSEHEANASPWAEVAKARGFVVKTWAVNDELHLDVADLEKLLSEKTKLVAMVHASNILGTVNPVKAAADAAHAKGALLCVDGVAYAPHRMPDVQALSCDFYVHSSYKVFGPHLSVLYAQRDSFMKLKPFNHYFISQDDLPYKLQLGAYNYEAAYSLNGVMDYFEAMYEHHFGAPEEGVTKRAVYEASFGLIADYEEKLAGKLIEWLKGVDGVRIIGEAHARKGVRVPTVSFVHSGHKSSDVVSRIDAFGIGIRFGDFYAKRIIRDLGLVECDGVIRVSLVHYNTLEEVDRLIEALTAAFSA